MQWLFSRLQFHMFAAAFALAVALLITAFFLFDGSYLVRQGLGYLAMQARARDIENLRRDGRVDAETLAFFDRLKEIRSFAAEELGLTVNSSFSRYVATDRAYLVDVVSAVRDDSFERHTWRYPVLGRLFYRGFYDRAGAYREAAKLRKAGFDVHVRPVRAFSSLGFFSDPAYSFMRGYGEYELANLIFHEQMHATVWAEGQNEFNEEIATFVGEVGAERYIARKYGADSEEYRSIYRLRADRDAFREVIRSVHSDLQAAYDSLASRDARLAAKWDIFGDAQAEFAEKYDELFFTDRYRGFAEATLSNAYIDSYMKYSGDLGPYYRLLERHEGDLRTVIDLFRVAASAPGDARGYVASFLQLEPDASESS
ncbi:MAG: aminopeptidase [Spirochaetia bacterium]